jgi:hypothetical protein
MNDITPNNTIALDTSLEERSMVEVVSILSQHINKVPKHEANDKPYFIDSKGIILL